MEAEDKVGQFVVLDGYFARIEMRDGSMVVFLRVDEVSAPGKVSEAAAHFQERFEAGEEFAADQIWMKEPMVRLSAVRWDEERQVLRLKLERVRLPPPLRE